MIRPAVRANQKDVYYLSQLTERFEDVSRSLLGMHCVERLQAITHRIPHRHTMATKLEQRAAAWQSDGVFRLDHTSRRVLAVTWAVDILAHTRRAGSQTLGEEYCDILQYDVKTRKPPTRRVSGSSELWRTKAAADNDLTSAQKRALLLALHIVFPYFLARLYTSARRALLARNEALQQIQAQTASLDDLFATAPPPPPRKGLLQRWSDGLASLAPDLPSFESLTEDYLRSVHLAVFYLFGRYYHLSKRGAGIRFVRRNCLVHRHLSQADSSTRHAHRFQPRRDAQPQCRRKAPRPAHRRLRTRFSARSWPFKFPYEPSSRYGDGVSNSR